MPNWWFGPWATPADLRLRGDAASIECVNVTSGRWRPLLDHYWDTCVIAVPWYSQGAEGGQSDDGTR